MTFKRFQEVVKKHYPQAVVYHHGEIMGRKILQGGERTGERFQLVHFL